MKMRIAERVDKKLLAKARSIDANTVDTAMRELDRRQSGWFGIPDDCTPESEYVKEAEHILADYISRNANAPLSSI